MKGRSDEDVRTLLQKFEAYQALLLPFLKQLASTAQQLEWLAAFARVDLRQAAARDEARWKARAFCDVSTERTTNRGILKILEMEDAGFNAPSPAPDISDEDLMALQLEVRKCFQTLAAEGHIYDFTESLFLGVAWKHQNGVQLLSHVHPRARFIACVVTLLIEFGSLLGFCAADSCRSPFARRRPWQRYCSRRCENRVAVARRRKKKNALTVSKERHTAYIRSQQRKHPGQKLRVQRRSRKVTPRPK